VERECVIRLPWLGQRAVRPDCRFTVQPIRCNARTTTLARVAGQSVTPVRTGRASSGTASPCSIRSAMTRGANAAAFCRASASVAPSAITPGSAVTSAIHLPSSSGSTSMSSTVLSRLETMHTPAGRREWTGSVGPTRAVSINRWFSALGDRFGGKRRYNLCTYQNIRTSL
jgi:hypothetical protein